MATRVECDNGHPQPGTCRKAARELAERGSLGRCSRCGQSKHYIVSHYYPYDKLNVEYEVINVYAVLPSEQAEREGWEPMVFLMKNRQSGDRIVWSYYWTKDRHGRWRNGQFPPLLTIKDLRSVVERFGLTLDY